VPCGIFHSLLDGLSSFSLAFFVSHSLSFYHTHPISLTHTLSLSHTRYTHTPIYTLSFVPHRIFRSLLAGPFSHTPTLSLSHTHTHTHTHTHAHTYIYTLFFVPRRSFRPPLVRLSLSLFSPPLSFPFTFSQKIPPALCRSKLFLSLAHTRTHTNSLSLSHTHTHTRSLSFSDISCWLGVC